MVRAGGVVIADVASYLVAAALIWRISASAHQGKRWPSRRKALSERRLLSSPSCASGLDGLRRVATGRVILTVFLVGAVTGLGEA